MCMHTNPTLSESRAAVVQSVTLSPLYCLHTNLTQLSFSQLISALLRQQIRLFAVMVDCTSEWWWNCDAVSASPTLLNVRAAAQYCLPPGTRSTERKKESEWRGSQPASLAWPQCALMSAGWLPNEEETNTFVSLLSGTQGLERCGCLWLPHAERLKGWKGVCFNFNLCVAHWTAWRYATEQNSDRLVDISICFCWVFFFFFFASTALPGHTVHINRYLF